MNKITIAILTVTALLLSLQSTHAGSAAWKPRPTSGDWNNAANWKPRTIPNGPDDTATFGASDTTNVSMIALGTELDGVVFGPGANAFTITTRYANNLAFTGFGIQNNSGLTQNFVTIGASLFTGLGFHNQAAAGTQTIFTVSSDDFSLGSMAFYDEASAAFGTFIVEGTKQNEGGAPRLSFFQNSTAASGIFTNTGAAGFDAGGGTTEFLDNSTAGNAMLTNKAVTDPGGYNGGSTGFFDNSTAAASIITNEAAAAGGESGGYTVFTDNATAGNAAITCEGATAGAFAGPGVLQFYGTSNAENATLIANGGSNGGEGGLIQFFDTSNGGTARVELFGNGTLDISGVTGGGVSIGSLEGDGIVLLGSNKLTLGTNNLSTVFSGVIQGSGAVVKDYSGTLTLSRANTYSGGTSVLGGFLKVSNRTGSATGSGPVVIAGSTLGGGGIVTGSVEVSGGILAPGTGATTLTVRKMLTITGAATYLWRVKTISTKADKVIADGVIVSVGTYFSGLAIGNTALPPGTTFTAIDNTSSDPINGTFGNLPDGGTITIGRNTFQANYEGGDGNDFTLTVVQ